MILVIAQTRQIYDLYLSHVQELIPIIDNNDIQFIRDKHQLRGYHPKSPVVILGAVTGPEKIELLEEAEFRYTNIRKNQRP